MRRRHLATVLLLSLIGCSLDEVALPNGCVLVYLNAREVAIADPDRTELIAADVARHRVMGDLVVGFARVPELLAGQDPPDRRREGFFVLDTRTREVWDPLPKDEWLERLRAFGIEDEPWLF